MKTDSPVLWITSPPSSPPLKMEEQFVHEVAAPTAAILQREGQGESSTASKPPLTESAVWSELARIMDPEIPVLSLVAMKIIREVRVDGDGVTVLMAPTFVGCPALEYMKNEVRARLTAVGCSKVNIEMSFSPPWSTDMLDEETKEKLRVYGVAPPPEKEGDLVATLALPVACPHCASTSTRMQGAFGATLCKQMFVCNNCKQPFERFKPL